MCAKELQKKIYQIFTFLNFSQIKTTASFSWPSLMVLYCSQNKVERVSNDWQCSLWSDLTTLNLWNPLAYFPRSAEFVLFPQMVSKSFPFLFLFCRCICVWTFFFTFLVIRICLHLWCLSIESRHTHFSDPLWLASVFFMYYYGHLFIF